MPSTPTPQWTVLPTTHGTYWRRVTLKDGLIYATRAQNVSEVLGRLHLADDSWNILDIFEPIRPMDLVTWNGPLIPPPNDSP